MDKKRKEELVTILAKKENTQEEIQNAIKMLADCGAIDYAKEYGNRLVDRAKARLKVVRNAEKKEELELLADMFVKRET